MNDNRKRALSLRITGMTFREIRKAMGLSSIRHAQWLCEPPSSMIRTVKDRAKGQCEVCGSLAPEGHIHHIRIRVASITDYNKADNLAFLCNSCHQKTHQLFNKAVRYASDNWDRDSTKVEEKE